MKTLYTNLFEIFSNFIFENIFCIKNQTRKKFELCQNDLMFTKIFELNQVIRWLGIHKDFK